MYNQGDYNQGGQQYPPQGGGYNQGQQYPPQGGGGYNQQPNYSPNNGGGYNGQLSSGSPQGYPPHGGGGPVGHNSLVTLNVGLKNSVFYPGNIVEGVVSIHSKVPVNYNAIRLKFCGKEKVHVQRDERIPDGPPRPPANNPQAPPVQHYKTIKRHHYSTNVILKQLITLSGDLKYTPMGQGNYTLAPGSYSYPFAFQLPTDLPPSFYKMVSDDLASMVFYCKAYVETQMGRDAVSKVFFTVIRPMPNSQWTYRQPASINRIFDVTCCCCINKGKVTAHITMDRTCIAIDRDWLQLFADLDNTQCSEPIENLQIVLRHTLKYKAEGYSQVNSYVAGHKQLGDKILEGQKGLVNGVIELPRNLLPSFKTPNVESSYNITISMTIPWADDPCHSFPVVIGQSVDDSNASPPITFNELGTLRFTNPRMPCQEFYYQVPPNPVYPHQPITSWSPPPTWSITYMAPPPIQEYYLPPQSWVQGNPPPPAYGQPANQSFNWEGGYTQSYAPEYQRPPPPSQPMSYGQNGGNPMNLPQPGYGGGAPAAI